MSDPPASEDPLAALERGGFSSFSSFSSYQPAKVDSVAADRQRQQRRERPVDSDDNEQEERRKRKKHKKKHSAKSSAKQPSSSATATLVPPAAPSLYVSSRAVEGAFRVDRKGDQHNVAYNSLYAHDIPAYRRPYGAFCLGVPPLRLAFDDRRGITATARRNRLLARSGDRDASTFRLHRYCHAAQARLLRKTVPLPVLATLSPSSSSSSSTTTTTTPSTTNPDYIPLESPTVSVPKPRARADPSDSASALTTTATPDPVMVRTRQLNEELRLRPHDVSLWLALVSHQDQVVPETLRSRETVLLEKKLSIYERAIEANPTVDGLIALQLSLCEDLQDRETVEQRWRQTLFRRPASTLLWRRYLSFVNANFSSFTADARQQAYERCLRMVSSVRDGSYRAASFDGSPAAQQHLEQESARLFARVCEQMCHSGYLERSIAAVQALFELNLFLPESLSDTLTVGRVAFLEAFWDSGAARFGEEGASGWAAWHTLPKTQQRGLGSRDSGAVSDDDEAEEAEEDNDDENGTGVARRWRLLEQRRAHTHWRPYKEDAAADLVDADRVVVFDDISGLLFCTRSLPLLDRLLRVLLRLLDASWCLTMPRDTSASAWELDRHAQEINPARVSAATESTIGPLDEAPAVHFLPVARPRHTTDVAWPLSLHLFVGRLLQQTAMAFAAHECHADDPLLAAGLADEYAAAAVLYATATDALLDQTAEATTTATSTSTAETTTTMPMKVKKKKKKASHGRALAKQLLQHERFASSAWVWSAYAETAPDPCAVYTAMVQAAADWPAHQRLMLPVLVLRRALLCSPTEGAMTTLAALCALVDDDIDADPSPTRLLRCRSRFSALPLPAGDTVASAPAVLAFTSTRTCHALFAYLNMGGVSLTAAREIFAAAHAHVSSYLSLQRDARTLAAEQLFLQESHLLQYHARLHATPPRLLRTHCERALALFPANLHLLRAFVDNERRSRISGHLRRFLDALCAHTQSPLVWQVAIESEMGLPAGQNRARALLARALSSTAATSRVGTSPSAMAPNDPTATFDDRVDVRQSALLWRLELAAHSDETARVKHRVYAALQRVPGVKAIFLDAVASNAFAPDEACDLMVEKGLRVRCFPEELSVL